MTISKGQPWGSHAPLGADGVVVASDAAARAVVERARRQGAAIPPLGLLGGDLCRTLGGTGARARLRSAEAVAFPVDLGYVWADGQRYWFVAHLVARTPLWRRAFVVMNAEWMGPWDVAPRSHPGDGLLDVFDVGLRSTDLTKVHARLPTGTHLPHPGIRERRVATLAVSFERPRPLLLDGIRVGKAQELRVSVETDALRIVI